MADDMLPKDISLQGIHTLQTDMAEAVNKDHISQASLIAEKQIQKKALDEKVLVLNTTSPVPSHVVRTFFIILITLGVVLGSGYGILKVARQKSQQAPVSILPAQKSQTLLVYDYLKSLDFSPADLTDKGTLATALVASATTSSPGITFYQSNVPLKQILFILSPSIPSEYLRSLSNQDFFGGNESGNFFIITVDSYDQAFAGSLQWEKTMNNDLLSLFHASTSTNLVSFEDRIIANKDTRAALNKEKETLFLYGFYDSRTIVFAENEQLLKDVYEMLLRRNL